MADTQLRYHSQESLENLIPAPQAAIEPEKQKTERLAAKLRELNINAVYQISQLWLNYPKPWKMRSPNPVKQ